MAFIQSAMQECIEFGFWQDVGSESAHVSKSYLMIRFSVIWRQPWTTRAHLWVIRTRRLRWSLTTNVAEGFFTFYFTK